MILALILFLGGLVILAWLFLWARQRQHLESSPLLEDMLADVPAASADDAVMVSREHGQLVYLNDRARRWLNLNGDEPDLEFVARLAQPADSFLELFGARARRRSSLGRAGSKAHRTASPPETRRAPLLCCANWARARPAPPRSTCRWR